jgi:hypothetical protein
MHRIRSAWSWSAASNLERFTELRQIFTLAVRAALAGTS